MKSILLTLTLLLSLSAHAQWLISTPDMPDTVGLWHLDAVDENVAWACAVKWAVSTSGYGLLGHDKGYYLKTQDGGLNWSAGEVPLGAVPFFSNICGLNPDEAWAAGLDNSTYENFILHTTDGGQTWEQQLEDGFTYPTSYVNFVHFWDSQRGVAMGDPATDASGADPYFEIYLTNDGGENWNRVSRDSIIPSDALPGEYGTGGAYQVQGNSVWFSSNKKKIYYSSNGGQSWFHLELPVNVNRFSFADTLFGVLEGNNTYMVTSDGGLLWTPIPSPSAPGFVVSLVAIPQSHYLLAVKLGNPVNGPFTTLVSKDMGQTWLELGTSDNACVAAFASPTVGYAGEWQPLDHATRMYSYNGDPLISGILSGKPLDAEVAAFPNPTLDFLKVNASAAQPAEFHLLLNDANGRLLEHQQFDKTTDLSASLDLRSYPAGIYSLTVSNGTGSLTKQIVKQ